MTIERAAVQIELEHPAEMARLLTLAGFIITAPRLADPQELQEDSFTFGYSIVAQAVRRMEDPRWARGNLISPSEQANLEAGSLLFGMKDFLTYRKGDTPRDATIAQNEVNPLLGETFKLLTEVGLLNTKDHQTSEEFQQFTPALHAASEACRERTRAERHPWLAAQMLLPGHDDFRRALRRNIGVLRSVVLTAPDTTRVTYDSSWARQTTGVPLPRVGYPSSVNRRTRPPIFEQRRAEKLPFYSNLHAQNAASYLLRLTDDVRQTDKLIRQSETTA